MTAFAGVGVAAVIATNTQGEPTPDGKNMAGVGGGDLHPAAVDAVQALRVAREAGGYDVGIIGCGGMLDGESYRTLRGAGADALMYYSALIYRGPTAGAIIHREGSLL